MSLRPQSIQPTVGNTLVSSFARFQISIISKDVGQEAQSKDLSQDVGDFQMFKVFKISQDGHEDQRGRRVPA